MGALAAAVRHLHYSGGAVPEGRGHRTVRPRAPAARRPGARKERAMNAGMNAAAYAFEARHVTKKFGANVVIEDLSIGFEPGMLHSILGPNGAGKTTLFNLLTRDLPVTSGEILLRGAPVTKLKPHQIARRGVGRSYQISSVYLDLSFLENVWLAAYRATHGGRIGWWRNVRSSENLRAQASELLHTLGLGPSDNALAKSVSSGHPRLPEIHGTLAPPP